MVRKQKWMIFINNSLYKRITNIVILLNINYFLISGSAASLVAGIVFGGIIAFGATQTSHNPKNIWVVLSMCIIYIPLNNMRYHVKICFLCKKE